MLDGAQRLSEGFGVEKKLLALSGIERRFLILQSLGLTTLSSIMAPRVLIMIINSSSEQCLCTDGRSQVAPRVRKEGHINTLRTGDADLRF